jgi:two-component system nitrogen regulation sensor histidine kinase GlnL
MMNRAKPPYREHLKQPTLVGLLDHLVTAVILLDADLCVRLVNASAESLLHISAAQINGDSLDQFILRSDDLINSLQVALDNGQPFTSRDIHLQLPESVVERIDLTVTNVENPRGLILEMHPTSRLNAISQGNSLESQQETTRSLIRGLAHEVKNPLGGIRGAAQLLDRALPSEELKEYTEIVISEADRLRDLVDRMLGPWQPLTMKPVIIVEAAGRVINILKVEFGQNIDWIRDYDPSLPTVEGDEDQLIQAILNIARNACEALAETANPKITIKTRVTRQFTIGNKRHKSVLQLDISNNGPSIEPKFIEQIFFPMISGRANGSGLGLSITQNIISRHEGAVQVLSNTGVTTFSLFLRFSAPDTEPANTGSIK